MSDVPMPKDLSEEAVAEWLHDDYEKSARVVGWKTQEACRVPWKDLPAANQAVMLLTARAVRALVSAKVREAVMLTHRKWRDATDPTAWHPMVLPLVREVTTELLGEEAPRG